MGTTTTTTTTMAIVIAMIRIKDHRRIIVSTIPRHGHNKVLKKRNDVPPFHNLHKPHENYKNYVMKKSKSKIMNRIESIIIIIIIIIISSIQFKLILYIYLYT